MTGHIIRNTGSAVTVQLPSGETVPARSVIEALDMVEQSRNAGPQIKCPECHPETCPCVPR